tara:strand:- start:109294 stop:109491 length:198 start_codon:yes stop_codon:yes gene_type:complete
MTRHPAIRHAFPALLAAGILLSLPACSSDVGRSQPAPGPMGSTSSPGEADIPDRNSESSPVAKPL